MGRRRKEDNAPEGFKTCTTCKEVKPVDDFYDRLGAHDGKHTQCKKCQLSYNSKKATKESARKNYLKHKEYFQWYYKMYRRRPVMREKLSDNVRKHLAKKKEEQSKQSDYN